MAARKTRRVELLPGGLVLRQLEEMRMIRPAEPGTYLERRPKALRTSSESVMEIYKGSIGHGGDEITRGYHAFWNENHVAIEEELSVRDLVARDKIPGWRDSMSVFEIKPSIFQSSEITAN
ncbi:hypothetical protein K432DRAFT_396632 [Lepidopterella palustris CBS 459.81]|uniref:Uncharacterized protein n=1 Tax=Lepidopterella palustris CBS 459.81 TaxID=1314670 RepID=A0A8E2E2J6_9PEZI|nr:hypothetical protein K432DRAFT_396632 [Lepidopterella palustris CBS 459.81]